MSFAQIYCMSHVFAALFLHAVCENSFSLIYLAAILFEHPCYLVKWLEATVGILTYLLLLGLVYKQRLNCVQIAD